MRNSSWLTFAGWGIRRGTLVDNPQFKRNKDYTRALLRQIAGALNP